MQIYQQIAASLFASQKNGPAFNENQFEIDPRFDFRSEETIKSALLRLQSHILKESRRFVGLEEKLIHGKAKNLTYAAYNRSVFRPIIAFNEAVNKAHLKTNQMFMISCELRKIPHPELLPFNCIYFINFRGINDKFEFSALFDWKRRFLFAQIVDLNTIGTSDAKARMHIRDKNSEILTEELERLLLMPKYKRFIEGRPSDISKSRLEIILYMLELGLINTYQ